MVVDKVIAQLLIDSSQYLSQFEVAGDEGVQFRKEQAVI